MSAEISGNQAPLPQELPGQKPVTIHAYSKLDKATQKVARKAIAAINKKTSTAPDSTWEVYTSQIKARLKECANAQNTFFVAKADDEVVGYVAFYTRMDKLPYPNQFLENDAQAYCSWTAVDEEYRGKGLATELKMEIFNAESKCTAFKGHIKKTNTSSLRVLDKFAEQGFKVTKEDHFHQVLYTVHKK